MSTGIKIRSEQAGFAERLREAWIALRYQHPILASLADGDRLVYHIADELEIEAWLNETFFVHTTNTTARELYGTVPRPFKRVVCHVLPHSQEILLQGTHAHLDGIGSVTLFDNLLRLLNETQKVVFGNEGKNLIPPFSTITQITKPTAQQKTRWDLNLSSWISSQPTLRLNAANVDQMPSRSHVRSLTFSEISTTDIVKSARSLGFTVTHVVQAAVALAGRIHGAVPEQDSFATFAIYNGRGYCDPRYDPSTLVGAHVFAAPTKFQIGSFFTTAQSVREKFVEERADRYSLTMTPTFMQTMPSILAAPQPVPSSIPLLSSFGNLDGRLQKKYGTNELLDYFCTLDEVTPDVYIGMWTFRNKLTIQIGFNGAFHEAKSIEWLMNLIKEQLAEGLGLQLEVEMS